MLHRGVFEPSQVKAAETSSIQCSSVTELPGQVGAGFVGRFFSNASAIMFLHSEDECLGAFANDQTNRHILFDITLIINFYMFTYINAPPLSHGYFFLACTTFNAVTVVR